MIALRIYSLMNVLARSYFNVSLLSLWSSTSLKIYCIEVSSIILKTSLIYSLVKLRAICISQSRRMHKYFLYSVYFDPVSKDEPRISLSLIFASSLSVSMCFLSSLLELSVALNSFKIVIYWLSLGSICKNDKILSIWERVWERKCVLYKSFPDLPQLSKKFKMRIDPIYSWSYLYLS